jgi:gamma-glutamylcyclotransferase (GGCT)/AIG2-like uncharacterized protein YtfP
MTSHHLFVYGSLRQGAGHIMYGMLAQYADLVGGASLAGQLYLVATYPGVIPAAAGEPAQAVRGEVYRLREPDTILPLLDDYEGFGAHCPQPNEFVRSEADVRLDSGEMLRAFVYIYNRPVEGLQPIASGDYLQR